MHSGQHVLLELIKQRERQVVVLVLRDILQQHEPQHKAVVILMCQLESISQLQMRPLQQVVLLGHTK
jgi:hypothetical protein